MMNLGINILFCFQAGFVNTVTVLSNPLQYFEINAIYHIFQNSFCAHVSRVLHQVLNRRIKLAYIL